MSRIEPAQVLFSFTSYLAGLFKIFILQYFMFDRIVCVGDFLPMRTLCDAYKGFESH